MVAHFSAPVQHKALQGPQTAPRPPLDTNPGRSQSTADRSFVSRVHSTTDLPNVSLEVMRSLALLSALLVVGCGKPAKPNTEPAKGTSPAGKPCGALSCRQFGSPTDALRLVLAQQPLVLGIGEAHAQRGSEGIRSATHRFTHDLLPILAPSSSDLVLELMIPDGTCKKAERQVRDVQKGVVKRQASSNQDEFTKLGHKAKALQVRPHVLRPGCDEFKKVKAAGPDGIAQMLTMIANLSETLTRKILDRNARRKLSKAVILYGGALHNDLPAVRGREKWTFGPALDEATGGRYVALDLIVPEFIKDSDSWRSLPWYPHYDVAKLGQAAVLYQTGPRAFTLIFPAST
jgi:hypothetical protein